MKKILYLLEYPIDLPGGAQMSTLSLCEGLSEWNRRREEGREELMPAVACPPLLERRPEDYGFRLVEYPADENRENRRWRRILNLLGRLVSYRRIIREERPDIIHIQMPESAITYGLLRGLGFFRGMHFIFTDRGLYFGYRRLSMALLKHALKYADKLLCTTEFNRKLWRENSDIADIGVISNTISKAFDAYDPAKRERLRKEQGFAGQDLVLGFAGRVCEEKNWPLAAAVCEELAARKVRFKIALVLSVFEAGDQKVVDELLHRLRQVIGEENVWYRQDLTQSQMADYYYLADIFVMTSRFESFGKAAVEAMSRRCAVVATNVGGLAEVVGKPENLYSEGEPGRCADYVEKLYLDTVSPKSRGILEQEKEYFYNRYLEKYTPESCLEEHVCLYEELLRQ